jgi:hypothetical protein
MSNLLNSNKPKKKLLERGAKITPEQQFNLDEIEVANEPKTAPEESKKVEAKAIPKQRNSQNITSVRVTKATRNKLNALIQMGKADNVDILIDILLDEYIDNTLVKDEKKTYGIVLNIIQKRGN